MVNVIGVRFKNDGKLYFFAPGSLWPTPGDYVIVETSRGVEFAEVVTTLREIDETQLDTPLRPVIRIASAEDVQHNADNQKAEREAHVICQKKIAEHKLDMKLVKVEYAFDNSKILFYFTANGRVDFRGLVKDLASVFKTRIELRQIGVRDEAKLLGGLGPCGRHICCGAFLNDFQPVSIKMAKEQNLSLNPTKISGICGRLMCCLKYEQDQYEAVLKRMPKVGKEVVTPDGVGVVSELNVIRETVRVRIRKGDSHEVRDYPMGDVQRAGQGGQQPRAAQADEAPVQENAAPASAEEQEERSGRGQRREKPQRRREEGASLERGEGRGKPEGGRGEGRHGRGRGDERRKAAPSAENEQNGVEAAGDKPKAERPAEKQPEAPVSEVKAAEAPKAEAPQTHASAGWKAALAKAMADATEK